MTVAERYAANLGAFSQSELETIAKKNACIVGCGGLGGYVINHLARFGVGALTLIDGDEFSQGNLNRQLFATEQSLGINKAIACMGALTNTGIHTNVTAQPVMLAAENAQRLLGGHDIVIDCLDNVASRRLLADACGSLGVPLVHGAISGLYGQVACCFPGSGLMSKLYPTDDTVASLGNPVFTPALVASIQSCEAVKLLVGRESGLREKVLYIDLQSYEFTLVDMS